MTKRGGWVCAAAVLVAFAWSAMGYGQTLTTIKTTTVAPITTTTVVPKTTTTTTTTPTATVTVTAPVTVAPLPLLITKEEIAMLMDLRLDSRMEIVSWQPAIIPGGLSFYNNEYGTVLGAPAGKYKGLVTDILIDPKNRVIAMAGEFMKGPGMMRNQSAMMGEYKVGPKGEKYYGLSDGKGVIQWYNQRGENIGSEPVGTGAGWSGGTMTAEQEGSVRTQFGLDGGSGSTGGSTGSSGSGDDVQDDMDDIEDNADDAADAANPDPDDEDDEVVDSDSDETPDWHDWIGFVSIGVDIDGRAQVSLIPEGGEGDPTPVSMGVSLFDTGLVSNTWEGGSGPINPLTKAGINVWMCKSVSSIATDGSVSMGDPFGNGVCPSGGDPVPVMLNGIK